LAIQIAWNFAATGQATLGADWFSIGNRTISISFEFDRHTVSLMLIVSSLSLLIQLYSIGFLANDTSQPRYFATLNLFIFSMLGLTLSGNLLQLFIFWELVGLCSYLLIGYYRDKPEASAAASKAFIMNKIGDVGFLIALMIVWTTSSTFEIWSMETSYFTEDANLLISGLILLAIASKSAQFPFHKWLVDAMEGPTPVSALIHSATMVAAGIFLMSRIQFLFVPATLMAATIIGGLTAVIGGLNALRENDLKKLLAWSTLSQLGLMVMTAGCTGFASSFVHLITHAIFKAGLFLVTGILIAHYGNFKLNEKLPNQISSVVLKTSIVLLVLSLMGIPFTAGFLSKESMLGQINSVPILITFFLTNLLTVFYSIRVLTSLFSKKELTPVSTWAPRSIMLIPAAIISTACLWLLYSPSPLTVSWVNKLWTLDSPSLTLALFSVMWVLACLGAAYILLRRNKLNQLSASIPYIPFDLWLDHAITRPAVSASELAHFFDRQILDRGIRVLVYLKFSLALIIAWFDRVIVDGLVQGGWWMIRLIGNLIRKLVAGKIQDYLWWTILALIILLIWAK
jgi:NADH-quinone oxidoreductase subunit L